MPTENKDEYSEIENEVENVLRELSNLEVQFEDVLKPRIKTGQGAVDTNYLVAVRRFQNGMRVSLLNGADMGNKETFEKGLEFYVGALTILKANSDIGEIQQLNNELIQTLIKIITRGNPSAGEYDPYGPFFLVRSCQQLATIYELSNEFELALKFRDRAANFLRGLKREFELIKKVIDAILCKKMPLVEETLKRFEIAHTKQIATLFYEAYTQIDFQRLQSAKNLLETLAAQRSLSMTQAVSLIQKLLEAIQEKIPGRKDAEALSQVIKLPAPSQSLNLSDGVVDELRTMLKEGIQQLRSTRTEAGGEAQPVDTTSIVAEVKKIISEEIKTVSSEIVSQILNKLPVGLPTSGPRAHSGGAITDDVPDIKVVAAAPGEKVERPKLDDMLDSIIVSD